MTTTMFLKCKDAPRRPKLDIICMENGKWKMKSERQEGREAISNKQTGLGAKRTDGLVVVVVVLVSVYIFEQQFAYKQHKVLHS